MAERTLIIFEKWPERETTQERIATLRADMTEAAERGKRELMDRASKLHVTGWTEHEDGIQIALQPREDGTPGNVLTLWLVMTRPD
jgi:hypothetical protein